MVPGVVGPLRPLLASRKGQRGSAGQSFQPARQQCPLCPRKPELQSSSRVTVLTAVANLESQVTHTWSRYVTGASSWWRRHCVSNVAPLPALVTWACCDPVSLSQNTGEGVVGHPSCHEPLKKPVSKLAVSRWPCRPPSPSVHSWRLQGAEGRGGKRRDRSVLLFRVHAT